MFDGSFVKCLALKFCCDSILESLLSRRDDQKAYSY